MKNVVSLSLTAAAILACVAQPVALGAAAPNVDTLKQALEKKLQKLRPDGMSERNVLFNDVRAGQGNAGSYPFRVSLTIRDYGAGYPRNHYYGQTCVSKIEQGVYTLSPDDFGGWNVEGRMTPDLSEKKCQNNPSAGVSSMPLSGLAGTPAPSGKVEAVSSTAAPSQARPAAGGVVAPGPYECWSNGEARGGMNFTVKGNGQYVDSDGKSGSFTVMPSTGKMTFNSGGLSDLGPGFSALYYEPQGHPTVSFRSNRGAEAAFCQKK